MNLHLIIAITEFELDLNRLYVDDEEVEEESLLPTWKHSFYTRHEQLYKDKSALEILNTFFILKSSFALKLVSFGHTKIVHYRIILLFCKYLLLI